MSHLIESKSEKYRGHTIVVDIRDDPDSDAPWDAADGHGPVSAWTTRYKRPGELVLSHDGKLRRYYDFQAAVQMARRDGWGYLPEPLVIEKHDTGGGTVSSGEYTADYDDNVNTAIRDVYRQHRETMTPGQYAAEAARRDFEFLRGWCNNEWHYVGAEVTVLFPGGGSEETSVWCYDTYNGWEYVYEEHFAEAKRLIDKKIAQDLEDERQQAEIDRLRVEAACWP